MTAPARPADPAAESVGDLGALIQRVERRRGRVWRLAFLSAWLVIIVALVAFVAATVGVRGEVVAQFAPLILQGVGLTLLITILSISLAIVLAALGAVGRLSANPFVNGLASFYVSFFRGTPLILQILFIFLALPQAGIVLPPIHTAIVALGFNYGAYMTEIFRAGIEAVPHGQTEAAMALGMNRRTTFRRIVLPQAFRIVTPAIGNDFIAMIKDSALAYIVGVQEVLWRAQTYGRRDFVSMQTLIIAALVYWTLTILFSTFQSRLERRMAAGDRMQRRP